MWIKGRLRFDKRERSFKKLDTRAVAKYVRISSRKVNIVLKLIRGKLVKDVYAILMCVDKRASKIIEKVLKSAVANAENNNGLSSSDLILKEAYVNNGPILKRFQPRAQGRAFRINKRTSHITLIVGESVK